VRTPAWWRARHPGAPALARALRAAVVVPVAFAVAGALTDDVQMPTFAAFGSFALLLFLDPPGPPRARLLTYGLVAGLGAVFISVATACSMAVWSAVAGWRWSGSRC
jgi:hypothetical protein